MLECFNKNWEEIFLSSDFRILDKPSLCREETMKTSHLLLSDKAGKAANTIELRVREMMMIMIVDGVMMIILVFGVMIIMIA